MCVGANIESRETPRRRSTNTGGPHALVCGINESEGRREEANLVRSLGGEAECRTLTLKDPRARGSERRRRSPRTLRRVAMHASAKPEGPVG